jgi:hypothetical protein
MFSPMELFSIYGNVIALDLYAPYEDLHHDIVEEKKYENKVGNKIVWKYKNIPKSWNIPDYVITNKPVKIDLNCGSFFLPHRDLVYEKLQRKYVRLNCHPNFTHPEECTYIIDNKIQHFRQNQWMIINSSLCHYSFCFKDGTTHYAIDIDISDKKSHDWLLSKIQYAARGQGPGNK